jgi:hypothetical protein
MVTGKRIVYFIGAGLSKALEKPGRPIPLMYDFVSVMADYAPHDPIILTTLAELENAGTFVWPSPYASHLAKRVVGANFDRSAASLDQFKDAMKRRPAESVEDLLLRASNEAERRPSSGEEALQISACAESLDRFRHAISSLFGRWIGWDAEWRPLEAFLSHQFASRPLGGCEHTFISFNYDLLLDRAIQSLTRDGRQPNDVRWHPSTGYGFDVCWYLEEPQTAPVPTVSRGVVTAGTAEWSEAHPLPLVQCVNVVVLKPHGSLNWIVRHNNMHKSGEAGLLVETNTPVLLPLTNARSSDLDYWRAEKQECANIHYKPPSNAKFAEAHCSIFIIPPTPPAKKTMPAFLTKVGDAEKAAIREADEIFVIGWSMPVTDQDQTCTIRCCVAEREKALESITVINRGEHPEYFERIADTFGVTRSRLLIFNDGFSDYVEHCTG